MNSTTDNQHRIAFLGACKVGKTSIVNQLVYNTFTDDYQPTLENDVDFMTRHNDFSFFSLLVDTHGGYDFPAMRRLSITRCRSFVVVFSLTDSKTYFEAKKQIEEIRRLKNDDRVHIVLVGNKRDITEGERIYSEEVHCYCESLQDENINCKFIKVSAMDHDDVTNMFNMLMDMIGPDVERVPSPRSGFLRRYSRSNSVQKKSPTLSVSYEDKLHLLKRSPSLFSLHNFSSDEDIGTYNYTYGEENKKRGLFKRSKPVEIGTNNRKLSVNDNNRNFNSY